MDALLNAALPFAKQQLTTHGEFFPYGVAMSREGQIALIAGYTGTERPPSTEVLDILYEGLRSKAEQNRGAAVVADVRLRGEEPDAIQVEVEHREGVALKVFLPYRKKRFGGGLETGPMRAEGGERRIWSR
ncbi:MAG: hypothetical protein E6I43_03380 [Chloroflexi bacterium]|nr:MAG: hypothetical protein E6I43_03380 [Chloroflexota bacterium]